MDERHDVDRAHVRVDTGVLVEVDARDSLARPGQQGGAQPARFAGQREDRAVVVGVGVDAEEGDAAGAGEGGGEGVDRRGVRPLGDVGDREEHGPSRRW